MKLASMGPMQAVLATDDPDTASELKPADGESSSATPPVGESAEGEDSTKKDTDEGFLRFIDFVKKQKRKEDKKKHGKSPKSRRECGLDTYEKVSRMELQEDLVGVTLDKAS